MCHEGSFVPIYLKQRLQKHVGQLILVSQTRLYNMGLLQAEPFVQIVLEILKWLVVLYLCLLD